MIPSKPDSHAASGLAAQQRGDAAEAEWHYRQALAAAPGHTVAKFNLGHLKLQQGVLLEATALLAEALSEDPSNPLREMTVRTLAMALFRRGWWELARPWLEEARLMRGGDSEIDQALQRTRPPPWLAPEVYDPGLGTTLRRAAAREGERYIYTIDIVGTCNLRCPSCPVGNLPDSERPRGFMSLQTFSAIVDKIQRETPCADPQVWLFNWGEPLLHPELPAFLDLLRSRGLASHLSSNLNVKPEVIDRTIAAHPTSFKVSISGMSQQTYGLTHRRGRVDRVIGNMRQLRQSLDRHAAPTHVWIGQHVYRSNLGEVEAMAALCAELRFDHNPIAAFFQPLEKLMRMAEGETLDEPILADLLEHPASYLPRIANLRSRAHDCELRANQTVINHDGSVALCCTVYEPENQLGLDFLSTPRAQIEARKYAHPTCTRCQRLGLAYTPEIPSDASPQRAA